MRSKKPAKRDPSEAALKAWDKRKEKYGETGVKGGARAATMIALRAWETRRKNEE
jgi:hypothetical protein